MGWGQQIQYQNFGFGDASNGGHAICGGGLFTLSYNGYQYLVVANTTDLYIYAVSHQPPTGYQTLGTLGLPHFITPVYTTGTVDCDGAGNLTGHGTLWNTNIGTAGFRKNMRIGDYIYLNNPGSTTINDPLDTHWHQIASIVSDTSATITDGGPVIAGQTYTLRQCMANNTAHARVSFELFPNAGAPDNQDLCFMANGGGTGSTLIDPIVKWDPTKQFAVYLSTYAFTCRYLKRFNNVLVYGALFNANASGTPTLGLNWTQIASSDNGLPTSLATGVSFQGVVSDAPEPILHLGSLGNSLLIYCGSEAFGGAGSNSASTGQGNVISAQFVGLPTVWQFQTVVRGRGPIARGLVAEFTDRHQFLAVDGEFRYNGMFLQPMNDHVFRNVIPNMQILNLGSNFVAHDPSHGDILWCIIRRNAAGDTLGKTCYTEHYMEMANSYLFKPITQRDAFFTDAPVGGAANLNWTAYLGTNPSNSTFGFQYLGPVIGDTEGNILTLGYNDIRHIGFSNTLTDFVRTCTFGSRVIAGERSRGLVKRIYPFIESASINVGGTTINVTLAMQDRLGGVTTSTTLSTYVYTGGPTEPTNRFVTPYRRGRVATITFAAGVAGAITAAPFILDGYDWDLPTRSPGGQR